MSQSETVVVQINDSWQVNLYFAHDVQLLVSESRLGNLMSHGHPFATKEFDMCIFPPGTFYHVFKDGVEINPDTDFNVWLRHQKCVGCHFNVVTKKPSVIKNHIKGCAPRAAHFATHYGGFDPLKLVCEWMTY